MTMVGVPLYSPRRDFYQPSRWYSPPGATANAGTVQGSTAAKGILLVTEQAIEIDQLAVRVGTNAAGNAQLSIYNADQKTLAPLTLVGKWAASVSTASAGNITNTLVDSGGAAISPILQPGAYWLFGQLDSTASGNSVVCEGAGPTSSAVAEKMGSGTLLDISAGAGVLGNFIQIVNTFGTWGDFTGASYTVGAGAGNFFIFFHTAASQPG